VKDSILVLDLIALLVVVSPEPLSTQLAEKSALGSQDAVQIVRSRERKLLVDAFGLMAIEPGTPTALGAVALMLGNIWLRVLQKLKNVVLHRPLQRIFSTVNIVASTRIVAPTATSVPHDRTLCLVLSSQSLPHDHACLLRHSVGRHGCCAVHAMQFLEFLKKTANGQRIVQVTARVFAVALREP
jgi:hypothetical protein